MIKGGAVSKHCSILNYIRKADEELYDLIQELCVGRAFSPRRNSPGITFLRPDKALLKEIKKLAEGDNPEEAVDAIQALILLDNLSSINDFDAKKSDIPTFHRKKLPITSVDGKKVILQNGAEIVPDNDFNARSDRSNLAVYLISKSLVPVDGEAADFSHAKVTKTKKGGAQLYKKGTLSRSQLFEKIVDEMYSVDQNGSLVNQRDAAMELIVSLYAFASKSQEKHNIAELIASQVTHDSLASLAVILQPYKTRGHIYLSDDMLDSFRENMYAQGGFENSKFYTYVKGISNIYCKLANAETKHAAVCDTVAGKIISYVKDGNTTAVAPATVVRSIRTAIGNTKGSLPSERQRLSDIEIYAEAELRVLSAVLLDNSQGNPSVEEVKELFRNCTLDEPRYVADKGMMYGAHISFYMSTALLILLSGAYASVPISSTYKSSVSTNVSDVVNANQFIDLSSAVYGLGPVKGRMDASQKQIDDTIDAVTNASTALTAENM